MKSILVQILGLFLVVTVDAQTDSVVIAHLDSTDHVGIIGLPYLSYAPETQLKLGVAGVMSFQLDDRSVHNRRASTISTGASISQLEQWMIAANFDLFYNHLRSRTVGRIGFERTPTRFYGVGAYSKQEDEIWYDPEYAKVGVSYIHRVIETEEGQGFNIGARLEYWNTVMYTADSIVPPTEGLPTGWNGGLSLGAGLVLTYDTRNNAYYPTRNVYLEGRSMTYARLLDGNFEYTRSYLDLRGFTSFKIGDSTVVIGGQGLIDATFGNAPFYDYPTYGGDLLMRGTLKARYVDKTSFVLQAEIRSHIWWKLGAAAFIAVGDVAPTIGKFSTVHTNVTGGAGLRVYLDKEAGLIARVDYGISEGVGVIYLSFGEAF